MMNAATENVGITRRYYFTVKVSRYYVELRSRLTTFDCYIIEEGSRQLAECVLRSKVLAETGSPRIHSIRHDGSKPL